MARPKARELTERELQLMHEFWNRPGTVMTAADLRDALETSGVSLAYTTVATLVRILCDKGFLVQENLDRPFRYKPARSYEEVSRRMLGDVLERVFRGSREQLLVRLIEETKLSRKERDRLREILDETTPSQKADSNKEDR